MEASSQLQDEAQRLRIGRQHAIVLIFALVHSALYCFLLPLWEGFDEPFHYAYVESLVTDHALPTLGQTTVSQEVRTSLNLIPISFILKRSIPGTFSFEDWFAFTQGERLDHVKQLRAIPGSERYAHSSLLNYEAQQAPLSYLLLAPLDAILGSAPLPSRILNLRLAAAFSSTVLIFIAFNWLCQIVGLEGNFRLAALALFFETQIYEAAVAHVANDWLSITAAIWFFAGLAAFVRWSRKRDAMILALVLAVGLLTKAYFLAFVPVFMLVLVAKLVRKRISLRTAGISVITAAALSGFWYLRNLFVYRTLAGMQESVKGVGRLDALYAFKHIHWSKALVESARWGLWTGNESHVSFSQGNLNLLLFLLLAGLVLFTVRVWRIRTSEWWVFAAVLVFVLALLYDLCVTWADTHGMQNTTGPYYTPCILPAVFTMVFLGCQRCGMAGRIIVLAISAVSVWISLLTYFAKLFPYYGGLLGRSTVPVLLHWWTLPGGREILSVTTIGSPAAVYLLLTCYTLLVLWIGWQIVRSITQKQTSV